MAPEITIRAPPPPPARTTEQAGHTRHEGDKVVERLRCKIDNLGSKTDTGRIACASTVLGKRWGGNKSYESQRFCHLVGGILRRIDAQNAEENTRRVADALDVWPLKLSTPLPIPPLWCSRLGLQLLVHKKKGQQRGHMNDCPGFGALDDRESPL